MFIKLKLVGKGFKIVGIADSKCVIDSPDIIWATVEQVKMLKHEFITGVSKSIPSEVRELLGV